MSTTRYALALAASLAIALALFRLMSALVVATEPAPRPPDDIVALARVHIVAEPPPPPPPPVTERRAPTPLAPSARPMTPAPALTSVAAAPLALPEVNLELAVAGRPQSGAGSVAVAGGDALAAFAAGARGFEGAELVPVASARPRYPRSAAARGIEGWVELIFVVDGNGRVDNVRVLDASPRGVFEDAAVNAMRNWVYAPYYVDGRAVAREGTQLMRFRLEDVQDIYLWDD